MFDMKEISRFLHNIVSAAISVGLLGLGTAASVVSVSIEVAFLINGCCLSNPRICILEEEFQREKTNIIAEGDALDQIFLECK